MSKTDITYQVILDSIGIKAFIMPEGFFPDVEIHCWGAGGGSSSNRLGGPGGYAKSTVNINPGDEVVLQIGQPGSSSGLGGIDNTYRILRGGNGSGGAGGGGASWVVVEDTMVCCGGGGGGGASGGAGSSGGNTAKGLAKDSRGGDGIGGGGGGGFPKGGIASNQGGGGGQSFGNLTIAGSGTIPGGSATAYYPGNKKGETAYPGYVILILRKKFNASIKNAKGDGTWANVAAAYVKLGNVEVTTPFTTTSTSTTNYSPNPSTLGGAQTLIDSIAAGAEPTNTTGWYTFDPNIIYSVTATGRLPSEIDAFIRSQFSNDLSIEIAGSIKYSSSEELQTSVTVGDTTYTRGSLAYSGVITQVIPISGGGTFTWSTTIRVYNFSVTTTSAVATSVLTVTGGWKKIQNAYVKVNDEWKSLLTNKQIDLYNYPVKRRAVTINVVVPTYDFVVYDALPIVYFEGLMDVNVYVAANTTVGSTDVTNPAFLVNQFATGDTIRISNYGNIVGRGGDGGAAGTYTSVTTGGSKASNPKGGPAPKGGYTTGTTTVTSVPGRPGQFGGTGLKLDYPTLIENYGLIAGGGGGGGGGGGPTGGQGGGGAGAFPGNGGNNGTLTAGGAGVGLGGAGGARGAQGSNGTNSSSAGGLGGGAGAAIDGVLNATITVPGSTIGPIT